MAYLPRHVSGMWDAPHEEQRFNERLRELAKRPAPDEFRDIYGCRLPQMMP